MPDLFPAGLALFVGACFIATAALKPAFMWETSKVRLGRRLLGERGLSIFFAVLGLLLVGIAIVLFTRAGLA